MRCRGVVFSILLGLFVMPAVMCQAQGSIFIVTDDPELEAEGAGNLGDYLRGLGYTVDVDEGEGGASAYRGALTAEEIAHLESYDLVIVHRATDSGAFDDDGAPPQWNALQVPLLMGSSYLPRDSRWVWIAGGNTRTAGTEVNIVDPDHPIVRGLTGKLFSSNRDIDHITTGDAGNGHVVATMTMADGTSGIAIAAWDSPGFFMGGSGEEHTARRVFFPLLRYHEDDCGCSFSDYTLNGYILIARAVEYTMTGDTSGVSDSVWEKY